jgi:hypothetical protein
VHHFSRENRASNTDGGLVAMSEMRADITCRRVIISLLGCLCWSVGCSAPAPSTGRRNEESQEQERGELRYNYRVTAGKNVTLVTWTDGNVFRPFDGINITVRILAQRKPEDKQHRLKVHVILFQDEGGKVVREKTMNVILQAIVKGPRGWQADLRDVFDSDGFAPKKRPGSSLPVGEYRLRITVRTETAVQLSAESYIEVKTRKDPRKDPERLRPTRVRE